MLKIEEPRILLRNARKEKELTLQKVSSATDIPVATISSWERGVCSPNGKNRTKISKYLGIPEEKLKRPSEEELNDVAATYETRQIMLHKNGWAIAEELRTEYEADDLSMLFARLLAQTKKLKLTP